MFEYDALKAAHRTAQLIKNPKGKNMNVNLDTFICSKNRTVHHRAIEILGALNKGVMPGSANRDGSGIPTYKIAANPFITSNTAYWWIKIKQFTLNLLLLMGKTLKRTTPKKLEFAL